MRSRIRVAPFIFLFSGFLLGVVPVLGQEGKIIEKTKKETGAKLFQRKLVGLIERIRPAVIAIGGGSGVIISKDGWVLTNHHVAGDESKVWTIRLPGGRFYDARITGKDVIGDITVLKIETKDTLPFLPLGESDGVEVGDWALAMGNPWGYAGPQNMPTVSLGIVSAVHRYQGGYGDAIQSDAPINPGNSGGPLINMKGEVIGINGRIAFRFGKRSNTGVGFAIPSNQIKNFLPKLKSAKGERVDHGEIAGLVVDKNPGDLTGGAKVIEIIEKTDAEAAGLLAGDSIIAVNGQSVAHVWRFLGFVSTFPAGERLTLKIRRSVVGAAEPLEKEIKVALVVGKGGVQDLDGILKPSPESPFLGIEPGFINMRGVQILGIWKSSPADLGGLRPGDTLLRLNGKEIADGWEFKSSVSEFQFGAKVSLAVDQGGTEKVIKLVIGNSSNYPLNNLLRVLSDGGSPKRTKSGVDLGFKLGDRGDDGIIILSVTKGGGADHAGLKAGDELLSLNGQEAEDAFEMEDFMAKVKPGSTVKLEIFRGGRLVDIKLTVAPSRDKPGKK
jgi:S1-C subfamily serine protease